MNNIDVQKSLKNKRKSFKLTIVGFTLVELLAVIVILAIILIIAVPGVLGIINKAKRDAWASSANVLLSTMKTDHQVNGVKEKTEYSIKDNKIVRKATAQVPSGEVPFDGKFEKSGEVTIDEKGKTVAAFSNDQWCAFKTINDTTLQVKDGACDLSIFDTTPPVVKQFVSTGSTSHSITVSLACEDPETRIIGYQFSKDGGKSYSERVEDSVYTFDKLKSGSYQLRGKCINKAELSAESEIIEKSTVDVETPTYSVEPSGDIWAAKKTVTITYPERKDGYVYEYSLDNGKTWISVDNGTTKAIDFINNGTVIARVYDGTNYKNGSSYSVGKVDSTEPTGVAVTIGSRTSSSIQVTANGSDDESGISKYEFSIDGKAYVDNGKNKTYTFTKVTSGNHTIKVRVTNGSGLSVESGETPTAPLELTAPVYTVTPSGDVWAAKKAVTITYPERKDGYIYHYSLNGGITWIEVTSSTSVTVEFTSPGTILARVYDGTNYKTGSSYSVGKVDSTAPTGVSIGIGTKTTNSIQVIANGSDPESGVSKYEFSIDGGSYINNATSNTYTFTNVTTGSHTIKVRLTNGSGLTTEASTLVEVNEIPYPTYSVEPEGDVWATSKTVTITYPPRQAGFVYQYSTNGGSTWNTVVSGTTQTLNFTSTGSVIARVYDGTNYKTASAYSIGKIDATPPTGVSVSVAAKTTNSMQVIAYGSDAESGIIKYEFSMDGGDYVSNGTSNIRTFTGVTSGSHTIKVRLTNGSGLTTEASTVNSPYDIPYPTYSVEPEGDVWATSKTVTITYPPRQAGFVYQYSTNGGSSWDIVASGTTKAIEFTANGSIIARIYDGTNYRTISAYSIGMIDTTAPTDVSVSVGTKTTNSIQVTANGSDVESGISKYEFSVDGKPYSSNGTSKTYTFTRLTTGSHTIKVRLTNGSGLTTEASTSVAVNEIPAPTYSSIPDRNVSSVGLAVSITYPATQSDFVYQYTLDGGNTWITVDTNIATVDVTSNGTLVARVYDGTNYKVGGNFTMSSIISPTDVSCFKFLPTSQTITGYTDTCPKDVWIPTSINGVSVAKIGRNAFQSMQLTSVTIPYSINTILAGSFSDNPLHSIVIQGKSSLSEFKTLQTPWYTGSPTITFQP